MALALLPDPHPVHTAFAHSSLPNYSRAFPRAMDQTNGSRISLPSISSLIEAAKEAEASESGLDRSPNGDHARKVSGGSPGHSQTERPLPLGSPRSHPPPTPPLPPTSSFDFPRHSPGNSSPASQSAPHPGYYGQTAAGANPELYAQRNSAYPPLDSAYPPIPDWPPPHNNPSPIDRSVVESSMRSSIQSYPDLPGDGSPYPGLAQQRPLPSSFPPPLPGQLQHLPPIDPQMAPTWQHHHFFPQTTAAPYSQNQERYICPTCNKPFSRPSSLKIHTYSHTGEKPYKCKHEGCGKYFSVRSNMKRHEKGCHGGDSSSTGGNSPRTA